MNDTIPIEMVDILEFVFQNGLWYLRYDSDHWEIDFISNAGEESMLVEDKDFIDGKIVFDIDGLEHILTIEDFNKAKEIKENGDRQ